MATTLYPKIDKADWSFLGTWREEAAIGAAEAIYHAGGYEYSDELEDLKQHALLYCATHSREINRINTVWLLRKQLYSRLVQDFRKDWEKARERDGYGTETELYGEDVI